MVLGEGEYSICLLCHLVQKPHISHVEYCLAHKKSSVGMVLLLLLLLFHRHLHHQAHLYSWVLGHWEAKFCRINCFCMSMTYDDSVFFQYLSCVKTYFRLFNFLFWCYSQCLQLFTLDTGAKMCTATDIWLPSVIRKQCSLQKFGIVLSLNSHRFFSRMGD